MNDTLQKIATGAAGIGGVEVVQTVDSLSPETVNNAVGLIGQVVIIIATLIGLFKRKKAV